MNKIIGKTTVGSHIWKMNHKYSDIDYFEIYMVSSKSILDGSAKDKSGCTTSPDEDVASHEIGHVINNLLTGNINFIIGVLSDQIVETSSEFEKLREITRKNISKATASSIMGMASRNYEKNIINKKDDSLKKRNQIMRVLKFGQEFLLKGSLEFLPYEGEATNDDILENISILQGCEHVSEIRDVPNGKDFRDWLYMTRLNHLDDILAFGGIILVR